MLILKIGSRYRITQSGTELGEAVLVGQHIGMLEFRKDDGHPIIVAWPLKGGVSIWTTDTAVAPAAPSAGWKVPTGDEVFDARSGVVILAVMEQEDGHRVILRLTVTEQECEGPDGECGVATVLRCGDGYDWEISDFELYIHEQELVKMATAAVA